MKLNSEKYPNIEYTPGEEIFLGKGEAGQAVLVRRRRGADR